MPRITGRSIQDKGIGPYRINRRRQGYVWGFHHVDGFQGGVIGKYSKENLQRACSLTTFIVLMKSSTTFQRAFTEATLSLVITHTVTKRKLGNV